MLLTTEEAADILRLKANTLAKWRSQKTHPELKYTKIGGKVFYIEADVYKFIEARIVEGNSHG